MYKSSGSSAPYLLDQSHARRWEVAFHCPLGKHLLSNCYVPGSILGDGDLAVNMSAVAPNCMENQDDVDLHIRGAMNVS